MKFIEMIGGINIAASNEENELIEFIRKQDGEIIDKSNLDERQQELARKMTTKGLLNRCKKNDKIYYSINDMKDIWRD